MMHNNTKADQSRMTAMGRLGASAHEGNALDEFFKTSRRLQRVKIIDTAGVSRFINQVQKVGSNSSYPGFHASAPMDGSADEA
jgi:hypothetical protein